jgi:hypothetical protein
LGFGFTGVGLAVVGLALGVLAAAVLDVLGEGVVSLAATSEHPASTNASTTAPATRPRRRDTIPLSLEHSSESQNHGV